MSIIETASTEDLEHILQLFPAATLREQWSLKQAKKGEKKKSKDEVCEAAVTTRPKEELAQFIYDNISCCKQHVHIFSIPQELKRVTVTVPNAERIYGDAGQPRLYLIPVVFSVVLAEPPEEDKIKFLWPFRVEKMRQHLVVRLITMEKNLGSYFRGRRCFEKSRSVDEESILQAIIDSAKGQITRTDLHKGIKKL